MFRIAGAFLVLVGLAILPAAPADASLYTFVRPATWAYTDSRTPHTSYIDKTVDAPIGAWQDQAGKKHKSRSYFSYDLAGFRGKRIFSAVMVLSERSVADCTRSRSWQLWTTDPIRSNTSWARPPRERTKIADIGGTECPSSYIGVDISDTVRAAVANGQSRLTLALRVPARLEGTIEVGRRIDRGPGISLNVNTAPDAPSQLTIDEQACVGVDARFVPTVTPTLRARVSDPDVNGTGGGDPLWATFAIWPVDRPQDRVELPEVSTGGPVATARVDVPDGLLTGARTYAFAVRVRDAHDVSSWSTECRFTVDISRPEPPAVTSTDYPADGQPRGGPGITGSFTFSPNASADVIGYEYGFNFARQFVAADGPGQPVTVQITPTDYGEHVLRVRSIDHAGLSSEWVEYLFIVRFTAPSIDDANPGAWLGDPHTLTFRPNMPETVSYQYRIDDGAEQTIAAQPDGTAQLTVVPAEDGTTVYVSSTTAAGVRSGQTWIHLAVDTKPFVESVDFPLDGNLGKPIGEPGTFTFKPQMHAVVEYVYQFNRYQVDAPPPQTVAAGADGTATITFTASQPWGHSLSVFSRTADGYESVTHEVGFSARSIAPTVTSTDYPAGEPGGGGPGIEGAFAFRPTAANVVEYTYQFGDTEPQVTVPAGADGTATIRWTPTEYRTEWGGWLMLQVRSRSADGIVSDWAYYPFRVNGREPTVTSDIYQYPDGGTVGQQGTFTFTAQLAGSVEFVYTFNAGPEQVVPVGGDGTATITWTPQEPYVHMLMVRSRTGSGLLSGPVHVSIWVNT